MDEHSSIRYDAMQKSGKPFLIAGPCVIESRDHCLYMAEEIKKVSDKLGLDYIFKASFDKANRTALKNYRGLGLSQSIEIFRSVREQIGVKTLTDFHESWQAAELAESIDILQIPAFLCRQTDMLVAAAETGRMINVKKGQFVSGYDTKKMVDKIRLSGNNNVFLTERGNTYGYGDYIVDFRNLVIMKEYAPVIFDVGHSLQKGCSGGSSGSKIQFAEHYLRAALAIGVDGIFMEVHDDPQKALSDGTTSIKLDNLELLLSRMPAFGRRDEDTIRHNRFKNYRKV